MLPIMQEIAKFLSGNLNIVVPNANMQLKLEPINTLYVEISAIDKVKFIVEYFNKFPLLGIKQLHFKDWELVYQMMIQK